MAFGRSKGKEHKRFPTSSDLYKASAHWPLLRKPREDFKIVSTYHPSNLQGKTIIVSIVTLPPGGATPSHRHGNATAIAIPLSGTSLNQMNGNAKEYGRGDFWYEAPGCHHQRSENISNEESATFFAILIVDDDVIEGGNYGNILVLDNEVEVGEKEASQ